MADVTSRPERPEPLAGNDGSRQRWRGQLEPPEKSLVECALSGQFLDLGVGVAPADQHASFDLATMRSWGADRTIRVDVLQHLLVASEWQMHSKGVRLRGARISGTLDLQSATLRCPLVMEDCYLDSEQPVVLDYATASLLRLVRCRLVGLWAEQLIVTKELNLTDSTILGSIGMRGADVRGDLSLRGATIGGTKSGYSLAADRVKVGGGVLLDKGFTAAWPVRLSGADITGDLNCTGSKVTGTGTEGEALVADGVKVGGDMLLDKGCTVAGAVRLSGAEIAHDVNCGGATIGADADHNAFVARRVKIGGSLFLNDKFTAQGAIRLSGAEIARDLSCGGATIGADANHNALVARRIKVGGCFYLNNKFTADGAVRISGAEVARDLSCRSSQIGADQDGKALVARGMRVGGDLFLDGDLTSNGRFTTSGAVLLAGANVTGAVRCSSASIGADVKGDAVAANGIRVGGDVFLDEEFTAKGAVQLSEAQIDGSLFLRDATLADRVALVAEGAKIGGSLVWAPRTPVTGSVNLERAHANRLDDDWSEGKVGAHWPLAGKLHLTGFVYDGFGGDHTGNWQQRLNWIRGRHQKSDKVGAHWPLAGKLHLTGFVYDGFGGDHTGNWQQRLKWIRGQHQKSEPGQPARFDVQPYDQLARVYRQTGLDIQARQIAIHQRSDLRRYGNLSRLRRAGNWLLDKTIAHGYKPLRAVGVLMAVLTLALLLSYSAQHHDGVMVPAKSTGSVQPTPTAMVCTAKYPCFYPAGYAVDLAIPIVTVGQNENWRLNGDADWGWAYIGSSWIITGLGWAFTTLAVAGYTGLIRRD